MANWKHCKCDLNTPKSEKGAAFVTITHSPFQPAIQFQFIWSSSCHQDVMSRSVEISGLLPTKWICACVGNQNISLSAEQFHWRDSAPESLYRPYPASAVSTATVAKR